MLTSKEQRTRELLLRADLCIDGRQNEDWRVVMNDLVVAIQEELAQCEEYRTEMQNARLSEDRLLRELKAQSTPEPRPDAVEALRPFVELYEKVDARYRKRGGNPDQFKDTHPFSDIPAGDLPMGVWRRAQAAFRASQPPSPDDARDAQRYRWLRDHCEFTESAARISTDLSSDKWDAAIDEAMRSAETKEVKPACVECRGAGQICTGNSGREDDGYAPILERCEACDGSGLGEGAGE